MRKIPLFQVLEIPEIRCLCQEPIEYQMLVDLHSRCVMVLGKGDAKQVAVYESAYEEAVKAMGAKQVVLVHNHPPYRSGRVNYLPSETDWDCTHGARMTLAKMGVKLIDHLIVGKGGVYSYRFRRVFYLPWLK